MTLRCRMQISLALVLFSFGVGVAHAADILVADQTEYREAVKSLQPGDSITLADGVWRDFEIVFTGKGTAKKPITLRAQNKGSVIISGRSNLRLAGEHLVVSGLVFRDGYTPTRAVIAFRRSADELAFHSRVTETVIDHFNNPERFETDFWVMMYGQRNRFDHNHLEGKGNSGVTMAVRLNSEQSQKNHHRIDHNYFGPRAVLGSNGGETLRIGTSKYSLTDSFTVVEDNFFDRCNGEVEIISSKSGRNTFRRNVFFESRGTLTLRHGNDSLIEENVFLGNDVDHTGGIRVINKRQIVRNNYLSGLKGYRFGGALVIMNGVPNSPINRYHQVEDSVIENNTILDSDHIELAAGSDDERSAVPLRTRFENNLIVNATPIDEIAVHDDISGITFRNNVVSGVKTLPSKNGFEQRVVKLRPGPGGLLVPVDVALNNVGISSNISIPERTDTGVSWYPKASSDGPFKTGKKHAVQPGDDTLTAALEAAAAGDVLELAEGNYRVSKILVLDHPVTVRAAQTASQKPLIQFERSTLFELADGGALELAGLHIDGGLAPDTYGNSAVRTSRYSMLRNYQVHVRDSKVTNLNKNHSFHFLKVAGHTFADQISITASQFENVTGDILRLDREIDDLGIYNAEYVTITDSQFTHIGGALATIYRGGTDESTFGPHVVIRGCTLDDVGRNKRNKSRASIHLFGVQVATVEDNKISNSARIRVVETVGEPITVLRDNQLIDTPNTVVSDGRL